MATWIISQAPVTVPLIKGQAVLCQEPFIWGPGGKQTSHKNVDQTET